MADQDVTRASSIVTPPDLLQRLEQARRDFGELLPPKRFVGDQNIDILLRDCTSALRSQRDALERIAWVEPGRSYNGRIHDNCRAIARAALAAAPSGEQEEPTETEVEG